MVCGWSGEERRGINLVQLNIYSRPVDITFLLLCQAHSHLSLYQGCVYMHNFFTSQADMFWMIWQTYVTFLTNILWLTKLSILLF